MEPVRIKYYGLFWMTRRGYLLATLAAGVFAAGMFLLVWSLSSGWPGPYTWPPPFSRPWEPVPADLPPGFFSLFYHYFWSLILLLLLAEVIDVVVTLRKFAQKEAARRAAANGEQGSDTGLR